MFGRSRVSERSSRFHTSAACITATNARQRNAMPADAFLAKDKRARIARARDSVLVLNIAERRIERLAGIKLGSEAGIRILLAFGLVAGRSVHQSGRSPSQPI